jgi:Tol biopolymer transport system component
VTESEANVYVMDQDGGHQVRLTTGFCGGFRPVWSPDGERIAFATGRDDPFGSDIFVMDADGSNVEQLTHEPEDNWPSSWR